MISDSHRFVFVHIPRTAGTSVETALAATSRTPVTWTFGGNSVLPHKHASAAALRALLGGRWERYFTFAIVRNPWDRMRSDYRYFQEVGPALYGAFSARERRFTDTALALDFTAWLKANADVLNMCQLDYLTDARGAVIVDEICRLETLSEDFERVCRRLDIDAELPRVNGTRRPSSQDAYTEEGAALVARYCARDIERFGYAFCAEGHRSCAA